MRSDWIARAHAFIHSNWRTLHIFRHITGFCRTTSPVPCHIRLQIASPTNTTSANTEKKNEKKNKHTLYYHIAFIRHTRAIYLQQCTGVRALCDSVHTIFAICIRTRLRPIYIYIYNSQSVITAYKVTDQRLCGVHICPIEAIVV